MLILRDLGHPNYLDKTEVIRCSDELEDAKRKVCTFLLFRTFYSTYLYVQVDDGDDELKKWISSIRNLYKTYDKLMFFTVSKVLSLYDILTEEKFSVDKMMQEIGILFKNDSQTAKKLKGAIEVQINQFLVSIIFTHALGTAF